MINYELMLILDPKTEIAKAKDDIAKYLESIKQNGKILNINIWGRKRLAYPIQKHSEGFYAVIDFQTESSDLAKELIRQLKINDNILRSKLIKKDK